MVGLDRLERPRVGDVRYFVEWCAEAVLDENGDFDHDATAEKEKRRGFADEAEARAFAESIYPESRNTYGIVEVCECHFRAYDDADATRYPHVGSWQCGRVSIFSGEWEE